MQYQNEQQISIGEIKTFIAVADENGVITFTWDAVVDATEYEIRIRIRKLKEKLCSEWGDWFSILDRIFKVSATFPGTTYEAEVRAKIGSVIGNSVKIKISIKSEKE